MKQHISHNGREEHWRALMTACDQRPAGQSITDWLRDNGICKTKPFTAGSAALEDRRRKIRWTTPFAFPVQQRKSELSFVEIPLCSPKAEPQKAPLVCAGSRNPHFPCRDRTFR